jgi:WbqC-like protein
MEKINDNKDVWGAIHSANFLSWLGTFEKIARVDSFIFFDIVQFPTGKNWGSRVKILLNGNEHWLAIPIIRSGTGLQKEYEVKMLEPKYNWTKLLATITQAYKKAPYYDECFDFLNSFDISSYEDKLMSFNADFTIRLTRLLGNNNVQFFKSSEHPKLVETTNTKTELIVETCQAYNIKNYLSGEGCLDFLNPQLFSENNINLTFQNFKHPQYIQFKSKEFVPGLSIIDALMNCGFEGVKKMINHTPDF